MNALTADFWNVGTAKDTTIPLRISPTNSGFAVSTARKPGRDATYLAEFLFKTAGTLLIPVGGVALFLPKVVDGPAYAAMQLAMLSAFVFVGVALHRWANKGFHRKIYVDSIRDEVRIGTVNIAGDFHCLASYRMTDIESFFIIRSKSPTTPAKLKMRLKLGARTIALAEGPENTCVRILERISQDLNPQEPKSAKRRYQTKRTGAFIRMTFG